MTSFKQSFNFVADFYERYRPAYPTDLFKDIISYSDLDVNDSLLEIGSGTGKATEGFLKSGYSNITCIEYGENLALLTQKKFSPYPNLQIVHSDFEEWTNPDHKKFDLAFSGTAFHFIPYEEGYRKVSSLLNEDGVLALFWFVHVASDEAVYQSIREVYKKHAPHLNDRNIPSLEEFIKERSDLTLKAGEFHDLKVHTYTWEQVYSAEDYIGLLNTHSGHQVLTAEQKRPLYQGIQLAIQKNGEQITKKHTVALFLTRKN
ncbi:class I SAM-dependent methyltransferase [Fictibacillus sp. UD]|uniref:rRNA adenine N-6-methyltransferase family protein n=1 Tax=Fictibacillus sp. UD TaxID=3038777 RepID=UPI0037454519